MLNKKVVLIAEDDPLILKSVLIMLRKKFTVYGATDGCKAWDILTSNKIDCLVTDMEMPNMSGLELLKKMKDQNIYTKTIVTTGQLCPDIKKQCMSLGINQYMEKPYAIKQLITSISKLTIHD